MAVFAEPLVASASPAEPMAPEPHRVVRVEREAPDVVTSTLEPLAEPLAAARPGQFLMVTAFGVGEIPISVSAVDDGRVGLTVRAVGAVSDAVVATPPGELLGLRGPYGTSWPIAEATGADTLVVAGGLGFAPLRTAIDALAAAGPERLTLVVGAREPDQLIFDADRRRWRSLGVDVRLTVDTAHRGWSEAVGTATDVVARLGRGFGTVFVCGPEPMMTSTARAVVGAGTRPDRVWVSLERNMHCGIAQCGRCQLGPLLLCRDGAVVGWDRTARLLRERGR
jgi:NAD(P)H-flavin reductase